MEPRSGAPRAAEPHQALTTLLFIALGYVVGSIPTGVLLARTAGVDVRRAGSGNIGATNVARTAGARLGLLTLVGDAAKGALPALAARTFSGDPTLAAASGFAAFVGHLFPLSLGFAGGKGVATALGVALVLCPLAAAAAAAAFTAVLGSTRYVSLGSLAGAAAAPFATALSGCPSPDLVAIATMGALIWLRHAANLARLVAGTEPRFAIVLKKQASLTK